MSSMFIIIIAIVFAMISISQYSDFRDKCNNKRIRCEFLVLSFCIAICAILLIAMVLSYGTKQCFILYAIDKFVKVVIMCFIILLTQDIVGVRPKYGSLFVSVMAYGSIILFLLESLFNCGKLSLGLCGVYFVPQATWLKLIYILYYMAYDTVLLAFVIYRASVIIKKNQKYELMLIFITYAFSAVGFMLEMFSMINGSFYIPFALIFNLIALIGLKRVLEYHSRIDISIDSFAKELDQSRLDITFILDDEMTILYQNKKAEILGQIIGDEYIGRKLTDVFSFNDNAYGQINASSDEVPFGITADYEPNKHHVNMVIQHRVDNMGEILASVVYVYNMEDEVKKAVKESRVQEEENPVTSSVLSITKDARVLIIDDDIVFANVLTRQLKQYEVKVERAFGGYDGIEQVKLNVYDLIFVALEMNRINGVDTVKTIRAMEGDYYKQVPIVYLLQTDVNDVFEKFVDSGFNDYIAKPVNNRNLSLVLTRWLWQRFDNDSTAKAEVEFAFDAHLFELSNLLNQASYMYENEKYINLLYITRAIYKCSIRIGHVDIAQKSERLLQALIIENTAEIARLYDLLQKDISDLITI